jgi:hypothetical protein
LFLPSEKLNVASAATLSFRCSGTIAKSIKQNLDVLKKKPAQK